MPEIEAAELKSEAFCKILTWNSDCCEVIASQRRLSTPFHNTAEGGLALVVTDTGASWG